jgi:hypothetical protein
VFGARSCSVARMMMIVLRLRSLLGLKSRWHRHFSLRPLDEVFF